MEPYQEIYLKLFNKITDLIEEMKEIQQQTEQMFMETTQTVTVHAKKRG